MDSELFAKFKPRFKCKFPTAIECLPVCLEKASVILIDDEINEYLDGANFLCSIGQGVEPVITYMHEIPRIVSVLGVSAIKKITNYCYKLARSPNKKALVPFLMSLKSVSYRVDELKSLQKYFEVIDVFVDLTQTVIHGHQSLYESSGLVPLLKSIPILINKLNLSGIANFIEYGARNYKDDPEQQIEYFSLQSHDAKSIVHRERNGITFKKIEHKLAMVRDCLWDCDLPFITFTTELNQQRDPLPYLDEELIAVPDVYEDECGISGLNRYRSMLAHLMAHMHWSTQLMADNYAPQMQLLISVFEDSRVDVLAMRKYPGLREYFLALHPIPAKNACKGKNVSTIRYRATRLSRTLIDSKFDPENKLMMKFRKKFNKLLSHGNKSSTHEMAKLGTKYFIQSRLKSDSLPNIYFEDTEVSYRDDNRFFWFHHEEYDEADEIISNQYVSDEKPTGKIDGLPPRYYDEWDYVSQSYRPDWTSVYERLHPSGDASDIDAIMLKYSDLAKRLKSMIEILKPQNKKRIRFQEEGEELDLDVALRSFVDFKSGQIPDLRINYSHTTDSRNIAVMLLVDLSESLNNRNEETGQTLLELSQEALAITAWTVDHLGDKFAIAGFNSDTRSEVKYQHIKGYSENYGSQVKARIANIQASYSTRMGAAMRHAAHYLESQKAEKKLMLVLTDGEPADIDAKDPQSLIKDAKKAVSELQNRGIYSYCITLDKNADNYVKEIFANHYTVIDKIEKLPEKLPQVFLQLTQ